MTPEREVLLQARKAYSKCAARVESRIKINTLTQSLSDQIIGVGVAADWVRRAAEMEDITYIGDQLNSSRRKESFVELLRFGFSWFGLNAIFSRPPLLHLIGKPAGGGEYDAFRVIFDAAPLPNAAALQAGLHSLLAARTSPRLPDSPAGNTVSTLSAIQRKYAPSHTKLPRTARTLADAAASGNIAGLDLPTMVYGFRNWSVHGNALDGCFGSRPGFLNFVGLLQQVLAGVHLNTATLLHSRL